MAMGNGQLAIGNGAVGLKSVVYGIRAAAPYREGAWVGNLQWAIGNDVEGVLEWAMGN